MSLFKGFYKDVTNWLGFEERPETEPPLTILKGARPEVEPVKTKKTMQFDLQKTNILLTEPRNIEDDYREILRVLREKQVVLINTKYLDLPSSKKLLDTASGVVYAINGHMTKVGNGIFLCAPGHVNVLSNEQDDVLFNDEVGEAETAAVHQPAATGTYDTAANFTSAASYSASAAPAQPATQPYFY